MSDKPYYAYNDTRQHLRHWIFGQMMSGAGKAALLLFCIGVFLYVIYGVSLLLPEQSKQAPSPQQQGAIEAPLGLTRIA